VKAADGQPGSPSPKALPPIMPKRAEKQQNVLKALLLAAFLVAAMALVRFSPLGDYLRISNIRAIEQKLSEFQHWAPMVFFLTGALIIALGAPRSLISIIGGIVFGLFWGSALALAAALLGSMAIFWLTKLLGRPFIKQNVAHYLKTLEDYSQTNGFLLVILLRQLPLTCQFVNVLMGLSSIPTGDFVLGSIVGLLPETLIFAIFGSSLREKFMLRVSLAALLLIALAWGIKYFYQHSALAQEISNRLRNKKS
jgi:uncharacterized membrane protein YdjX (TVP38/TMEM64 family)